jgi:peptide/nickel transport system substrate-binding protein
VPDRYVRLARFENYVGRNESPSLFAGGKPAYLDEILFCPVPEPSVRASALEVGEFEVAEGLPLEEYERWASLSNLHIENVKAQWRIMGHINHNSELMNNLTLRRAIQAALNMEEIMLGVAGDPQFYRVSPSLVFDEVEWASDAGAEYYNQNDREKAKRLMREAGYNGQPIVLMTTKDYSWAYRSALVMASQLQTSGFNIDLQVYDWPTLVARREDPSLWDMFITGGGVVLDPAYSATNEYGYQDPESDRWAREIRRRVEPASRYEAWAQYQRVHYEQVKFIHLGDLFGLRGYGKRVRNTHGSTFLIAWDMWLYRDE